MERENEGISWILKFEEENMRINVETKYNIEYMEWTADLFNGLDDPR